MKTNEFVERSAVFVASESKIVTKDLDVFYNPLMAHNRDVTVLVLLAMGRSGLRICDPLAGSGVRAIRLRKELPQGMVDSIVVNDLAIGFEETFRGNLSRSGLSEDGFVVSRSIAQRAMTAGFFDYIDVDPFGSPNPFLDAAVQHVKNKGVVAVTATDTSALCGTYPKACLRKYGATPLRGAQMHEGALRILIRKAQLVGAQYGKALTPVFSMAKDHYVRVFFSCVESKQATDAILAKQGLLDGVGPMWLGGLWDASLVERMCEVREGTLFASDRALAKVLETIRGESAVDAVGFVDIHEQARILKEGEMARLSPIIDAIRAKGFACARTHLSATGIRTTAPKEAVEGLVKKEK
ncbi:MAG: hypothetical protein ABIH41_07380 [Nanoarchaeota archaeon]